MTRIMPSDPRWAEIDRHQRMLCLLHNAQCHHNLRGLTGGTFPALHQIEAAALVVDIESGLTALLRDAPPTAFSSYFDPPADSGIIE